AVVTEDVEGDVGVVGDPGQLGVEGEVVLPRAKVHPQIQLAGVEGAGDVKRRLVLCTEQLEVEVGKQLVEDLGLAVADDGCGAGRLVVRDGDVVGRALRHDAEAGGPVRCGERIDRDRQQASVLQGLEQKPSRRQSSANVRLSDHALQALNPAQHGTS